MSTRAQVKTPAKTPAAPAAARIPQPPVAEPVHEAERRDIGAQLEGATRLGHNFGAVRVDGAGPSLIQRLEIPEEEEEELQLKREPAAVQRQELPEEEEEELQLKREPAALQRQELPEEEEEELQLKPELAALQRQELPEEEEEELQTKPANDVQRQGDGEGFRLDDETAGRINRARGGGQPLERALQAQMSASLGHDFSGVRVHTDAEADALNRQLSARAFTTGPDIFFQRGEYNPGSSGGQELLAHELTHVVQQSRGIVRGEGNGVQVRPHGDCFEQEAERRTQLAGRTKKRVTYAPKADQVADLRAWQRAVARPDFASTADILSLQRTVGNRAMQRVLAKRVVRPMDVVQLFWKCPKCQEEENKYQNESYKEPVDYICKAGHVRPHKSLKSNSNLAIAEPIDNIFATAVEKWITEIKGTAYAEELQRITSGSLVLIDKLPSRAAETEEGLAFTKGPETRYIEEKKPEVGSVIQLPYTEQQNIPIAELGSGYPKAKVEGAPKGYAGRTGVTKQEDFPEPQPWGQVLQHELVHAYLAKKQMDLKFALIEKEHPALLRGFNAPYTRWNAIEEGLVTGICWRYRLSFSENAYREIRRGALRERYTSVGLYIPEASQGKTLPETMPERTQFTFVLSAEIGVPVQVAKALYETRTVEEFKRALDRIMKTGQ